MIEFYEMHIRYFCFKKNIVMEQKLSPTVAVVSQILSTIFVQCPRTFSILFVRLETNDYWKRRRIASVKMEFIFLDREAYRIYRWLLNVNF